MPFRAYISTSLINHKLFKFVENVQTFAAIGVPLGYPAVTLRLPCVYPAVSLSELIRR